MNGWASWATVPAGRRGSWAVLALWALLLVPALLLAGRLGEVEQNDNAAWLPGGAESTAVVERAAALGAADTVPAIVLYDRPTGITSADLTKARADATAFGSVEAVVGAVRGPVASPDGKALQTVVQLRKGKDGWEGLGHSVDALTAIGAAHADGGAHSDGLGFHVTGPAGYASDSIKAFGAGGSLTTITAVVVVLILLLTYRSPWLPLLSLVTVGGALAVAEAAVFLLARYAGLVVNKQTGFILVVLVFGAATDYALLLIARYREELATRQDPHEAMARALRRCAPAITASAATVAAGLLLLTLAELNSTRGMGPACAIGVLVGWLAMLTLMPALLVVCGRRAFWPRRPEYGVAAPDGGRIWTRLGDAIARRPRTLWIGTALALGALALGCFALRADGLADTEQFTGHPQTAVGKQIQAAHFPAGAGDPLYVVARADAAGPVRTALASVPGVLALGEPLLTNGQILFTAELSADPSSRDAMRTVSLARTAVHAVPGADALVGGTTAIALDTRDAASRDDAVIIPVVLLTVLLILAVLLRSAVTPLLLIGTVVLSFGAALGVSALVFRHLFHFAGTDASFPLLVFVFLVALGVDYNIFLVTRVREDARTLGTRRAARTALTATGGVITSAGLVLAGTFAAMASLPLVFAAELGFTVAFGVLLDTLLVRSVLVTALALDTGPRLWWPARSTEPPTSARSETSPLRVT
ncbi:MMPL family transporter [Kitasatospora sp. CB01950]|uniref:MMPL family transporter n=1 Tax=Kitasatospora sp. CB01950 TaxID=1703930 RepID=UPI000938A5CA|nr:MMPL family transporter [Kitasatospora sp. CB01950]OKJ09092.1 hypothetical protein AMK19_16890 [Kitasatospora sp. CB01950]